MKKRKVRLSPRNFTYDSALVRDFPPVILQVC